MQPSTRGLIFARTLVSTSLIAIGVWLFGFFVKFPQGLLATRHFPRLEEYIALCANSFGPGIAPAIRYRISVPILMQVAHLPPATCAVLPTICLIAAYAIVFYVVSQRTKNKQFALLVVAGLSLTFFALWTTRWIGYPDSFSHLWSALALLSSNPIWLALSCILGLLNDERWVFSIPLLLYWHGSRQVTPGIFDRANTLKTGIGLSTGLALVFLVRHAITVGWIGPGAPGNWYDLWSSKRLFPYNSTWALFALNVFMGFGWYWFAIARLAARELSSSARSWGYFLAATILFATLSTGFDEDVSRSVGFLFLALVAASVSDHSVAPRSAWTWWRNILVAASLTPTAYYIGFSGAVFLPAPVDIANQLIIAFGGPDFLQEAKSWFQVLPP
jgi:hypothetical protein